MLNTLIVEDNAAYRESLCHVLTSRFPTMQINEAADGVEALNQALSRRFDLILMDIRLPHGNGITLTKIIKAVFSDSMICVISSYDILEYREAAFRNGADHFIVKGGSTEAEVIGLIDSLLQTRFITLILASDALLRKQLCMLLSIRWPTMILEEAADAATGLNHATTLKPNLVLLELGLPEIDIVNLVRGIRVGNTHATIVGMTCGMLQTCREIAQDCGLDHCAHLHSIGHTKLMTIVQSMQSESAQA